jgi:integrase
MSTKRANGQGSVYKRGHYWTAQVTIGHYETGGPKYKRKGGFRTKTEALEAIPGLKDQATAKPVPTVSYYYRAFCKGKGATISEDKQDAYRIAYNKLEPIHTTPVSELTVPQLQELVSSTCKSYYPARDVRALLNHIFRMAAADGNANPSVPGLIELPRLKETHREAFTDDEQKLLWAAWEAGKAGAEVPLIMIYTGMMTGEMRRLEASMIDLEKMEITGVGLKTKERRSKSVLIPEAIVPILQDLISQHPEGRIYTMSEEDFYTLYYSALAQAGVTRHLTPYSCRHTTATALAISAGVAPQTVQRIMRWSSTKMMDRYVHPDDNAARKALEKIKK